MITDFIVTDRIRFGVWTDSDNEMAMQLWGDSEVTQLICASERMSDVEVANRLRTELENYNEYGVQYWPMFSAESSEFIGCCGLRPYDIKKKIYEIGFHLRRKFWGKEYAFEAASAVIEYGFSELGVISIFSGHNSNNLSSKGLLLKLGFEYINDEYYEPTGLMHPSYRLDRY